MSLFLSMLDTVDFSVPNESLNDCNVRVGKDLYLLIILTLSSINKCGIEIIRMQ